MLPKLFWPAVRKNCSSDREKTFEIRGWRQRICKKFEITRTIYSNRSFDACDLRLMDLWRWPFDSLNSDALWPLWPLPIEEPWLPCLLTQWSWGYCTLWLPCLLTPPLGLFLSDDIMVFDFLHFMFFQVQYIHYCWKHYVERLRRNFYIFFMEVINWKENKKVGTICFEVRIPMNKPKIFMEFFYVSFQK